MDLEDLIRDESFLSKLSESVRNIICASFPNTTASEREDIDQEVKLKLCRMAADGKKIANIRSYLWRMVYTTTLDVIGKRLDRLPPDGEAEGETFWRLDRLDIDTPQQLTEAGEQRRTLEKAIESLPERRRLIIKLHLMGMGIEEAAEFLSWSPNKVRHLLYRGLAELKRQFGMEEGNRARAESASPNPRSAKKLVLKESDD